MNPLYRNIRNRCLSLLPGRLIRCLKQPHYFRVVRDFDAKEEPDLNIVQKLVREGETAFDIGANIGVYTKFLSEFVGPSGRVLSLEPVPETFSYLSYNGRKLGLTNIRLISAAACDFDGTTSMSIPNYHDGGKNLYQAQISSEANGNTFWVSAKRLDSLIEPEMVPSFIKIDVEGAELSCLMGAEKLLDAHKPSLLVEISSDPDGANTDAAKVFEFLSARGYSSYWFADEKLRPRKKGDSAINYFFLQDCHLERVRENLETT